MKKIILFLVISAVVFKNSAAQEGIASKDYYADGILNAQTKETKQPFYSYFLWYNGTIGSQAITAKISLKNGNYRISYAYNYNKRWIYLNDVKQENKTISGKTTLEIDNYTNGSILLQLDNLWNIKGQWTSKEGEKLPITLKVALNELPLAIKITTKRNELLPLLLEPNKVADSIQVYYSEKLENGKKSRIELQTYKEIYPDEYNQIIYVDINFDGYLDLKISDAIYLFNIQKQRFEVENSYGDMFPCENFNIYKKTFSVSHWRTISWYKAVNGVITPYETEEYMEYSGGDYSHNIEVSENRIRIVDGTEKYSTLDLYVNNDSIKNEDQLVKKFIGDTQIGIMRGAKLILRYPSGKNHHYKYQNNNTWKTLFIEFEGEKVYPTVKKYYDNGQLKSIGSYDEEGYLTGKWKSYARGGSLQSIGNYKDSHFIGKWEFYSANKQEHTIKNYNRNGKKTGEWKYYRDEKLNKIERYLNGKREGEWKKYSVNGQTWIKNYKNDEKHGEWKFFYQDEKLKRLQHWVDGEPDGISKWFHKNGNLGVIRHYNNGTPIGKHKEYYKSGEIKEIRRFENGKTAEIKNYYESGPISATRLIKKDKVLAKSFYEIGEKLGSIGYNQNTHGTPETGKWKYYHQNGKLHYKGIFSECKRVGKWKGYHSNGKRKFKGNYEDGKKIGIWKFYLENGKLGKIEHWEDGKLLSTENI